MKKALTAALVIAAAATAASAQNWLGGPLEDALAKAKASNKPLLLDFFQESG